METKILEEFIEDLKKIVPENKTNLYVPTLLKSQVYVIEEIIKMAEEKVKTNKNK